MLSPDKLSTHFPFLISLDFDINAHQSAGLSSDRENVLALGTENKKRVVVDGVTHDNENIRIEEGHVNKFKFNPLSLPKLGSNHPVDHFLSTLKSIDYENSKTTNLQVGDKTIQERKHNDIVSDVLSGPGKFFFG